MTNPVNDNTQTDTKNATADTKSVVPMIFPAGLCIATIVLSSIGYGFRIMFGDELGAVLKHAAVVMPAFVIGIPFLIWLGSIILNKLAKTNIHPRNAWTLGWLLSVVALLTIMGAYS